MKNTNDDVLDTPEDEDVWNGDPLFEEKHPTKAKPKKPTEKVLKCTQKGCRNLQTADGEFCDKHYPEEKTRLYASIRIVKATCKLHAISQIEKGTGFLDTHELSDVIVPVSNLRIGREVKGNTSVKATKGKQRFSLFTCNWKEDRDWKRISAFQRKHGLPFMDSFTSKYSDDKVLVLSDRPFTTELANDIWVTTLQEETHDLIGLEVFTYAEYLEAKKDIEKCDICHQPEDENGRCGCTNKDAHSINCTCPDCSSIS